MLQHDRPGAVEHSLGKARDSTTAGDAKNRWEANDAAYQRVTEQVEHMSLSQLLGQVLEQIHGKLSKDEPERQLGEDKEDRMRNHLGRCANQQTTDSSPIPSGGQAKNRSQSTAEPNHEVSKKRKKSDEARQIFKRVIAATALQMQTKAGKQKAASKMIWYHWPCIYPLGMLLRPPPLGMRQRPLLPPA